MPIHLISPTHDLRDGSLHETTRYWTSAITLSYLKALTPSPHQVDFTDEVMSDLDLARVERPAGRGRHHRDGTADPPRLRSDHFRGRGKKVVLGGTLVSLVAAGRVLDGDWSHCDYGSPVVQPRHMTTDEMLEGFRYVSSGFYSVRSMLHRFMPPPRRNLLETVAMLVAKRQGARLPAA
jgi:hypothetical protein